MRDVASVKRCALVRLFFNVKNYLVQTCLFQPIQLVYVSLRIDRKILCIGKSSNDYRILASIGKFKCAHLFYLFPLFTYTQTLYITIVLTSKIILSAIIFHSSQKNKTFSFSLLFLTSLSPHNSLSSKFTSPPLIKTYVNIKSPPKLPHA